MRLIVLCICVFAVSISYASNLNCNIKNKDDICLNDYIKNSKTKLIKIPERNYVISSPIILTSNSVFDGSNAIFISNLTNNKPMFLFESLNNVVIKNLRIIGNGAFLESSSQSVKLCGFSNGNSGLLLTNSKNIVITNISISGMEFGIFLNGSFQNPIINIDVNNNMLSNLGEAGIRVVYGKNIQISDNQIERVLGNQTPCMPNWISNSKFADGVYLENSESVFISKNTIKNVKRIGIVLDNRANSSGQLLVANNHVLIKNNIISNVNDCRGTENNAGIWVEPWQESRNINKIESIEILHNKIDNQGAITCNKYQLGIFSGADNSIVENNEISNFSQQGKRSVGIRCAYGNCNIVNNKIYNTNIGILLSDTAESISYQLENNQIHANFDSVVHNK